MGATDNILAAIAGTLEGARDVIVPFETAEFKRRLSGIPVSQFEAATRLETGLGEETILPPELIDAAVRARVPQAMFQMVDPEGAIIGSPSTARPVMTKGKESLEESIKKIRLSTRAQEEEKADVALEKEKQQFEEKKRQSKPTVDKALREVIDEYDKAVRVAVEVKNELGLSTYLFQNVPLTESKATASKLQTLKTKVGFNALQKMRDKSPTGGALGQVSEKEGDWLQNSEWPLDLEIGVPALTESLNNLIEDYNRSKSNLLQSYKEDYGSEFITANKDEKTAGIGSVYAKEIDQFLKQNPGSKFLGYE